MADSDILPPTTTLEAGSADASASSTTGGTHAALGHATQTARDTAASVGQQATDKAREFADMGKEKVGGLLDQLAQLLTDAAGQVDERLGAQFGDHARTAATSVQGFAQSVRNADVDQVADQVRGYVARSPGVAVGVAAALGFGVARLVHAGLDQRA